MGSPICSSPLSQIIHATRPRLRLACETRAPFRVSPEVARKEPVNREVLPSNLGLRLAALAVVTCGFVMTAAADPIPVSESTGTVLGSEVGSASAAKFDFDDGFSPGMALSDDGYGGAGADQAFSLTGNPQTAMFDGSFDPAADGKDITVSGFTPSPIPQVREQPIQKHCTCDWRC